MKKVLLILLALSLTACSLGRLAYNNFHYVVMWKIDDYIDLDRSQKRLVRQASKDFIIWHRENELPKYKDLLQHLYTDLKSQSLTLEAAAVYEKQAQTLSMQVVSYLQAELPALLMHLTTPQYQQLVSNLRKRSEKRQEKTLEDRIEDEIDDTEEWFGKLNKAQEQVIIEWETRQMARRNAFKPTRDAWFNELEYASVEHPNRHNIFNDTFWSRERMPQDDNEESFAGTLWLLSNETQRQKVLNKLADTQKTIDDLLPDS